jgi:hypothetical protein
MAKALSHVHSSIRGSVGGLTYSANQYAQILLKTRIAPVQPNTAAQTLVRSCVNEASLRWRLLTDAQRLAWDLYAQTVTYVGPQGTYQLTGRQIFIAGISLQAYAVALGCAGASIDDDPPTVSGKYVVGTIAPAIGPSPGTGIGFSVVNGTGVAGAMLVNVSPPQPVTRNRYKGPWDNDLTVIKPLPATASSMFTIACGPASAIFFVRLRFVTLATPARVSSVEYLRLTAATLP